jgi:hypothetical protein
MHRQVRIGGASGFWGDSSVGAPQLVERGEIQYLVFDYLAELTMSLLAGARLKDPESGYATDFVTSAMAQVLPRVASRNIKVITNAGGVNPRACAQALEKLAQGLGLKVRIAVVLDDDVIPLLPALRDQNVRQMYTCEKLPGRLVSANAYLGAAPIAMALDAGAQIVITGRCVDSAVTLGILMHEFGWSATDWDKLAGGSLAGHIIECGCQATGGLHTDWQSVPRLGAHRLPGGRMLSGRQLHGLQARGHRRSGQPGDYRGAIALRDRRSVGVSAARCGVRLHPGANVQRRPAARGCARNRGGHPRTATRSAPPLWMTSRSRRR